MNVKITGPNSGATGATVIKLRCPVCKQRGTFEPAHPQVHDIVTNENFVLGIRRCPDPSCNSAIYFIFRQGQLHDSYPAETIDFDTTNIPTPVQNALEEAIKSHAQRCFIAAAIMVRKTLEELCRDRGATGTNLKDRLKALGTRIVLPSELLAGLDDLRLLGNDAAHVESQEYVSIGQEEVEVGIEFTKEVLKAVYQYSALLSRLRALKTTP